MQVAIKEDSKFESEVRDDPLKFLLLISTLMYTTVRERYPLSILADTLSSMFNIRQGLDEKFTDFLEKLQQGKNLVKIQLGKGFLEKFMSNTAEFNTSVDADERMKIKDEAFERFMAVLLLRASDQITYGKMQDDYKMAYANTRDKYPKSVKTMVDVMR